MKNLEEFEWTSEIIDEALRLWDAGLSIDEVKKGAGIPFEDHLETFVMLSLERKQKISEFIRTSQQVLGEDFYASYAKVCEYIGL